MAGLHVSQLFRWRKELEPPNRLRPTCHGVQ
ncbi:hypothetical protein XH92_35215 [Bradyrhizobium sp. CCBAU 53421]|nr:hypothetical protein XH92_35215 [Bradyrhizobium sp. CCBAU 53421]